MKKIQCEQGFAVVEECENWAQLSPVRGCHCWNCGMRDGYPSRGWPDGNCENFKLLKNTVRSYIDARAFKEGLLRQLITLGDSTTDMTCKACHGKGYIEI